MELLPDPGDPAEHGGPDVPEGVEQGALERALVREVDGVVGRDADEDVDEEAGDVAERQVADHPLAVHGDVVQEAVRAIRQESKTLPFEILTFLEVLFFLIMFRNRTRHACKAQTNQS